MKDALTTENSLILKHYKEPLLALPKKVGFGYYGAISITLDEEKLQCHVCGELRSDLGRHVSNVHMSVREYKDKFKLSPKTALLSEAERMRRKGRMLLIMAQWTPEKKKAFYAKARSKYLEWRKKNPHYFDTLRWKESLEKKNIKGTCPDQLLEKLREVTKELGHTPSRREFVVACKSQRYIHLIQSTFGSWTNALKRLGLTPKTTTNGKGVARKFRTDEELLSSLLSYYEDTGRVPTSSDAKRGFIPNEEIYIRRFGGIKAARELAGVKEKPLHPALQVRSRLPLAKVLQ